MPFAAISFAGFVGVVTGFSQTISMSEKVWETYRTPDVQPGTYEGMSLVVVIREMLQFGGSRAEAIAIAERAQRTWAVFLGVGGEGSFSALGYRHASLDVFGAANMSTVTNSPDPAVRNSCASRALRESQRACAQAGTAGKGGNAPPLADLVYIDRHPQPSSDPTLHTLCAATAASSPHTLIPTPSASPFPSSPCPKTKQAPELTPAARFSRRLAKDHGQLTAAAVAQNIPRLTHSGDVHTMAVDFARREVFIAVGAVNGTGGYGAADGGYAAYQPIGRYGPEVWEG